MTIEPSAKWLEGARAEETVMYQPMTLSELLDDPLVASLNASDGFDASNFKLLLTQAADNVRNGRKPVCDRMFASLILSNNSYSRR